MIRKPLRDAIFKNYRPGQEIDKKPSVAYLAVQRRCVAELCAREYSAELGASYLVESEHFRAVALRETGVDPLQGVVSSQ